MPRRHSRSFLPRRLACEPLESRNLLAVTLNVSGGLFFKADGAASNDLLPDGSRVYLLVDTERDGFGDLTTAIDGVTADDDDVLITSFGTRADGTLQFTRSFELGNGIDPGDPLLLTFYDKENMNFVPGARTPFGLYRNDNAIDGSISWHVPADGTVVDGESAVNQAPITGESVPVEKVEGDEVIGGSLNSTGSLIVEVEKTGESSYLNQVITLVREAQASQSRTQNLADRAAYWLTLIALAAGGITFAAWYGVLDETIVFSLERTVTVMVITCPHALGLAIPLVVAVSTGLGAQRGLLIRDRAAFERARNLDTVVFDKTGTLTEGRFGVTDVLVFEGSDEAMVLRQAAAVEQHSEHPIAAGILQAAEDRVLDVPNVTDFEAITGKGVRATVEDTKVRVLSPGAAEGEVNLPEHDAETLQAQGKTVVYVVQNGMALGALALADIIREESREAIQTLHDLGIDVVMLTGDNERVANWVAEELGLDRVIAEDEDAFDPEDFDPNNYNDLEVKKESDSDRT